RDGLDPGDQRELDAHQRQPDEPERDGEVGPEPQSGPIRAHQREDQRRHADPDEDPEPRDPPNDRPHRGAAGAPTTATTMNAPGRRRPDLAAASLGPGGAQRSRTRTGRPAGPLRAVGPAPGTGASLG